MSEEEKQSVVHEINSRIASVATWFVASMFVVSFPLLGLMVSNHFALQQLKIQVTEMSQDMKLTNERVTIMWMLGGYSERYEAFKQQIK